jgi:hypothetical protein
MVNSRKDVVFCWHGFPPSRTRANTHSSSRAHCGAKCRYADTGSLQTHALVTIPDGRKRLAG